jgi:hypothetical protein
MALVGILAGANAYTLDLSLSTPQVAIGDEFSVTVTISDVLPNGLGSYSLDFSFAEGVIGFNRVVDGLGMGNTAFGLSYALNGNVLTLTDTSFDDVPTLLASQSPSFALFTLYFDAIGAGSSPLSFSAVSLADAYGNEGGFIAYGSRVAVTAVSPVPEPGALPLFALGCVFMLYAFRHRLADERAG